MEWNGMDRTGQDRTGQDRKGKNRTGKERKTFSLLAAGGGAVWVRRLIHSCISLHLYIYIHTLVCA
jgi:hypothetical protein